MNKWLIVYRILLINVVLFTTNVVGSANSLQKPTIDPSTTHKQNVDSSKPTNTNSGDTPKQTSVDSSNTDSSVKPSNDKNQKTSYTDKFKILAKTGGDSTKEIDSSKYDIEVVGETYIYTFKEGANFCEFKFEDITVWKHLPVNKEEYPTKLTIIKEIHFANVSIDFKSYFCVYLLDNHGWRLRADGKNNCYDPKNTSNQPQVSKVTVNVTKTSGNSDYDNSVEENKRTFTPKDGKAFDTVKDGYFTTVWDTKDGNLLARSVVYSGVGTQNLSLTVNHSNNTYTTFTKQDGKWKQHSTGTYESEESTETESKESTKSESDEPKSQPQLTKSESEELTVETPQSTGCLDKVKNCFSNMHCISCRS